jgi:hypothetical protein
MPTIADINPFSNFSLGGWATTGKLIIIFILALLVVAGVTVLIIWWLNKRKYWISIPLYRKVGNVPTRVANFKARVFPIGKAGDKLWFVKGVKKYIPPATLQSAPNEFWHWERADGEWINFTLSDLDHAQKKAGVRFIHQDMRSQRVATSNLLEQRLMQKGFWEKWGVVIGYVIFFLVITVAVVINLYMMGKVVEALSPLITKMDEALRLILENQGCKTTGIVPALSLLLWRRKWT